MYQKDFRKVIGEQVARMIRDGNTPWQRPRAKLGNMSTLPHPYNAVSNRRYQGGNALVLALEAGTMDAGDDPRWCTFKQASDQGWKIKRGAKARTIEYWRFEDKREGEEEGIRDGQNPIASSSPRVFYAKVFHASQIEGIPVYIERASDDAEIQVQRILDNSGANIQYNTEGKMSYLIRKDQLQLPIPESFDSKKQYYAAAMRGMAVWAGHPSRLGCFSGNKSDPDVTIREYFRIQLANWLISARFGLPFEPKRNETMDEQCADLLANHPNEFFHAARDAEKITEYIVNLGQERKIEYEQVQSLFQELDSTQADVNLVRDLESDLLHSERLTIKSQ